MIEELGLETFTQPIHQSSLVVWKKCPRKGFWRYRLGLELKRTPLKKAAQLGQLVHRHLELGPGHDREVEAYAQESLAPHLQAVESGEDMLGLSLKAIQDTEANLTVAKVMAELYWEKYPSNPNLESVVKEEEITDFFTLNSGTVWLGGRLDDLVRLKEDGSIWNKDIKTTSQSPELLLAGYHRGPQKRMYRMLGLSYMQRVLGLAETEGPKGFVLNVLRVPGIKMGRDDRNCRVVEHTFKSGKRKGQTELRKVYEGEPQFENYLKRVRQWYIDNGESAPIRSYMIPYLEPIIPPGFEVALQECSMWSRRACAGMSLQNLADTFYTDPTGTECSNWNQLCPYATLCAAECHAWPRLIKEHYQQVVPDVYINESGELVAQEAKEESHDCSIPSIPSADSGSASPGDRTGEDTPALCLVGSGNGVQAGTGGSPQILHPGASF